ncbi:hypothetical protein CI15_19000 [Paraburkholderia monticola]|uniref:Uncharacterized protein n=1 Tax=Paraburkholderia monticola TaxID=1399968 RepID=A0A149PNR7_9BURK|nr:hypothetical protein [Paraburkholderia monticola]KXU86526.1 hypothetical protein CI15_19000 [Paraburkholderia monticola]
MVDALHASATAGTERSISSAWLRQTVKPTGARNSRARGFWQVAPYASKLTRAHRAAAKADHAFARALREQTIYPQRIDALIAGRTWFDGKECAKCGGSRRRVYDVACYDCTQIGRGFKTGTKGRCIALPPAKLSRDGWLARNAERKREAAGEYIEYSSGEWSARQYPTGRLSVRCLAHHIDNPDFRTVHGSRIFQLCEQHPDLLILLRRAGWSI